MNLDGRDLPLAQEADRFNTSYALPPRDQRSLADRWILSRLEAVQNEVTRLIDTWQFGEAGRQLYEFLWNEYCDWYIEAAKVRLYDGTPAEANATAQVLAYVLEHSLRLLHPYMPYVTEKIWQNLPGLNGDGRALIISRWPHDSGFADAEADDAFSRLQEIVRAIRNVRSEYNVEPGRRIPTMISAGEYELLIQRQMPLLATLARLANDHVAVAADLAAPDKAVTLATSGVTIYVPLAGLVDLEAERNRLQKEIDNLTKQMDRSQALLNNQGFVAKAPPEVIERERAKYDELNTRRQQLSERLRDL
jgi:valyl-tRNA synthetase